MSEEDQIAAEARRIAEERSYSPERFLAILDRGANRDFELDRLPASQREILLPPLRTMARERDGTVRLNAAYALLKLSDPVGCEVIVACLKTSEPELRNGALDRLLWLGVKNYRREQKLPSTADADTILTGLDCCLADPNPHTRARAVQTMSHFSTPRALDRLSELLHTTDPLVRTEAAIALGLAGCDRGALAVLDDLLNQPSNPKPFPDINRFMLVKAVATMCRSSDPKVGLCAAVVAARVVRGNLVGGNEIANDVWNLLDGIAAAEPAFEPELLREVLASEVDGWARGVALNRLAELSGKKRVARCCQRCLTPHYAHRPWKA